MTDPRVVRKLFAATTAQQVQRKRGAKQRQVRAVTQFCDRCYAVLDEGRCPGCTQSTAEFEKFCRRCLYIHAASKKDCAPWRSEK